MQAAKVADAFALLMGFLGSRGHGSQYPVKSNSKEGFGGLGGRPTRFSPNIDYCSYCKKPGHTIQNCRHANCKSSQSQNPFLPPKSNFGPRKPVATANVHDSPQKLFQRYIFSRKVSLTFARHWCRTNHPE